MHIPVGATATIQVPTGQAAAVTSDGGATPAGVRDGYASFTAGSGDYTFHAQEG